MAMAIKKSDAAGPDGLSAEFYYMTARYIAYPLSLFLIAPCKLVCYPPSWNVLLLHLCLK